MLDTNARRYVDPFIQSTAKVLIKNKFTANQITVFAFLLGISTSLWICIHRPLVGLIFLWISGFFDAVDGAMARYTKTCSPWGTLMDIVFDRLVEVGIVIGLAVAVPEARFSLLLVLAAIIFSMCVFLTVGALSENYGIKSFHYQAGLMERTEGFIGFSIMMLFHPYVPYIAYIFAGLIAFTAIQRMLQAKKSFNEVKK